MIDAGLRRRRRLKKALFYLVAIALAIIICIPFYWMIITSLKSRGAIMSIPVEWFPQEPTLESFRKLLAIPNFVSSMLNSFYITILCTAARLLSASMTAYALTKIKFKGRDGLFRLFLVALMIPAQITFIPIFVIMTKLGLNNSLNSFIFLQLFNAFAIFMLRQKMMTINDAYIEAAVIDGAGHWRIFWKIIIPFCSGTLAVLTVISFMDLWNDYLLPLVLLTDQSKYTFPILLSSMSGQYKNQYNLMMAGSLVSIIPILLVYIGAQKFFKDGMTVGGIKG